MDSSLRQCGCCLDRTSGRQWCALGNDNDQINLRSTVVCLTGQYRDVVRIRSPSIFAPEPSGGVTFSNQEILFGIL